MTFHGKINKTIYRRKHFVFYACGYIDSSSCQCLRLHKRCWSLIVYQLKFLFYEFNNGSRLQPDSQLGIGSRSSLEQKNKKERCSWGQANPGQATKEHLRDVRDSSFSLLSTYSSSPLLVSGLIKSHKPRGLLSPEHTTLQPKFQIPPVRNFLFHLVHDMRIYFRWFECVCSCLFLFCSSSNGRLNWATRAKNFANRGYL